MALFKVFRGTSINLPAKLHDGYAYLTTDDGKFYIDTANKRILINPDTSSAQKISYSNGGVLTNVGAVLDSLLQSSASIETHTSNEWAGDAGRVISSAHTFYIYDDGHGSVPRIKMGDGLAYISDLPFLDEGIWDELSSHINNSDIHVTLNDKLSWWNKLNVDDNHQIVQGALIFNRN